MEGRNGTFSEVKAFVQLGLMKAIVISQHHTIADYHEFKTNLGYIHFSGGQKSI